MLIFSTSKGLVLLTESCLGQSSNVSFPEEVDVELTMATIATLMHALVVIALKKANDAKILIRYLILPPDATTYLSNCSVHFKKSEELSDTDTKELK